MRIRAAVVEEKGAAFTFEDLELDAPNVNEVLVRIVAVGICQTDVHMQHQEYPVPMPIVLGHEGAGIVERTGSAVRGIVPGDKVVLSFPSCGHCNSCLAGSEAYCVHSFALCFGGQRLDGSNALHRHSAVGEVQTVHGHFFAQSSFATYSLALESNVVKVPDDMPLQLLGPLGCGFQTGAGAVFNSLRVDVNSSIAVFGVGAVGLAAVMAARVAGASRIIAVDINDEHLQLAKELGATTTLNSKREPSAETIKSIEPLGLDYVLELTARPEMLKLAVDVLAPRGTAALVGGAPAGTEASIDMNLLLNGRTLRGIIQGDSVPRLFIPKLIELYRSGRFPIDKLIRFYDFAQINEAIEDMRRGRTIKAVLKVSKP
jgi:aryl-alcohol dehydrogenase